jgi:hypothetical protein
VVGKVEFYANTNEKVEFALSALRSKLVGAGMNGYYYVYHTLQYMWNHDPNILRFKWLTVSMKRGDCCYF